MPISETALRPGDPAHRPRVAREIAPRLELLPLQAFVGRWSTVGTEHESPLGPGGVLRAVERWVWLPGNQGLEHRFDGRLVAERLAWVELVTAGPVLGTYVVERRERGGGVRRWRLAVDGEDAWSIRGRAAKGIEVRGTLVLDREHGVLRSRWELSQDGTIWEPYRELVATREVRAARPIKGPTRGP